MFCGGFHNGTQCSEQKSLVERMDALDQEREKLQNRLVESEERQSELQEQLKCTIEEKKQLMDQSAPQQVLLSVPVSFAVFMVNLIYCVCVYTMSVHKQDRQVQFKMLTVF